MLHPTELSAAGSWTLLYVARLQAVTYTEAFPSAQGQRSGPVLGG